MQWCQPLEVLSYQFEASYCLSLSQSEDVPPKNWADKLGRKKSQLKSVLLTDKWILAQKLRIPKIQDTICKSHETQEERRPKCGHFAPS